MIHITDGRTDDIIGFFTQKDTTFNEHTQNLETYQDSFEFSTFGDHKYAHTLTDMNRVIIPAEDGGYSEYVIDTARKSRARSNQVRVKSFASYQMLSVAKVIRPTSLSAYTPSQALGFITNDTEWRPGITESNATRTFHIENYTDRFSFLKTIANEYELEIRFRVETDGKRVTGRFIDLLERVGDWRGREITFGKDLDSIERTEEFGNIYTKLICLGPEDEDGNRLEIEVTDDDALRRWGRPHPITGELMHLEDTYEPTSERTDMTETELRQYGRTELNKRINAVVTYEAEVVDLENVPGMANKKIRFGDTVRIKDEKFNPPLYVEARIFEQRRDIFTKSNKKVKLGDFIEYTEEELKAVIDRLSKIIKTKIDQAQLVEHTYSKIEIDTKDEYIFGEGKTFAEAVGITAEDNAKQFAIEQDSALKIDVEGYADQVADQAEDNAKQHADDVSAQALQQALAESVSQESYDTKMQQIASDLGDKAGITYIDGKLQIIDGAIDDLNAEIDTKADGSTVYTISEVDNMINNTVSVTQYQTDISGIVTDLSSQGTQIGQNTEAIGLKADQTTVDALSGTVNSHSAQLLTMADEISAKVSADYVQTAIDDIEIGGRNLAQGTSDSWETKTHSGSHFHVASQYSFDALGLSPGDTFTLSIIAESMSDKYALRFRPEFFEDNSNRNNPIGIGDPFFQETRCVATLIVPNDKPMLRILFNGEPNNDGVPFNYRIKSIKIEKGNKATDWSPAPEDVEAEISSLSAELSVQAGLISAKADSSTVNALGTRVSTAETKVDAIEGQIVNKVEVNDVKSIFTQEAGSFTFQANQINFDGHVFGQDATFTGKFEVENTQRRVITSIDDEILQERILPVVGGEDRDIFRAIDGTLLLESQRLIEHHGAMRKFTDTIKLLRGSIEFKQEIAGLGSNAAKIVNREGRLDFGDQPLMGFNDSGHGFIEVSGIDSQGSNTDGHWISYSNGIQICWHEDPTLIRSNATSTDGFFGLAYGSRVLSFPQNFIGIPTVTSTVRRSSGISWSGTRGVTQSSVDLYILATLNSTEGYLNYIAVGRWK